MQLSTHAASSAASLSISILAVALGASTWGVGLIAAGNGVAHFASSWVFGRAADVHGRRRLVKWGLGLATLAVVLHAVAWDPVGLGVARASFGLASGMHPAALTSLAHDANRRLGKFQSFGSLGMSVGVLAGGLVGVHFGNAIFLLAAGFLAVAFLVSLTLVYPPEHRVFVPVFPKEVIERNAPAYAAMVMRHAGATAAWVMFPLLLLELGADLWWIGVAHALNGAFQFVFMRWTDRFAPSALIVSGLALTVAAFALLAVAPTLAWALAAMPLVAASWAALYMGSLRFVLNRSVERATATGLLSSSVQLASIIGPIAGGAVAHALGLRAAIWVGAAASVLAIPLYLYELARHPPSARDISEERVELLLANAK